MADRSRDRQRSGNPAVRGGIRAPRETQASTSGADAVSPFLARPDDTDPAHLPADGAPYPLALRNERTVWWRSLLGVVFGLSLYLLLVTVVSQAVVRLAWGITHPVDYATYYRQAFAYERPSGLLASDLGISTLIPIAMVLVLVVHQVRTRWLFSVGPGIRWRYLLICLGVSLVAVVGVQLVASASEATLRLAPQPDFWLFLVIIVLTSPLQAAAEEIFFRGYVMQSLGSIVARPWFGVVTSAVVFALMHGTQNLALFANRLAFGLLAGLLVWWVGGLEAGIAAHVANNVVAFVWAGLTSSIAALNAVKSLTWAQSGIQILGFGLCAALTLLVARVLRLRNRVDLEATSLTGVTGPTPDGLSAGRALR